MKIIREIIFPWKVRSENIKIMIESVKRVIIEIFE